MKPLVLTLRTSPDERLDLSALVPHRLSGRTAGEIARLELQTGRQRITVGDIFRVRGGDPRYVRIEGGTDRLDQVGQDMTDGEIVVEGEVGSQAGRSMAGGRLVINGDAGRWAASGMRGGHIEITGVGRRPARRPAGRRSHRNAWRSRGGQGRRRRPRRGSFAPRHHHRGGSGRRSRRQLHDRRNFDRAACGRTAARLSLASRHRRAGRRVRRAFADIPRLRCARFHRHAADGSVRQGLQRCRCCCPAVAAATAGGRHGCPGQGRGILCRRVMIGSNRQVP